MDQKDTNYSKFKQEFWEWFDSLPQSKKRAFQRYKDDAAETNFYYTVWKKKYEE
jgi:hypothetical protein